MAISYYKPSAQLLAVVPKWTGYGEPYAKVYEYCRSVHVTKHTKAVVEDILAFNGQTLRGAKDGAQLLLEKKTHCTPILINELHKMYAIITGPVNAPDTAYIMLGAVLDAEPNEHGGTNVKLINGEVVPLKIKHKQFQKYRANAAYLQFKKEQHTTLMQRAYQYCEEYQERYDDELNKD